MKKIFSVKDISGATGIALLIARVGIAALMLTHGIPKLMMLLSGSPVQFPALLGTPEISLGLTIFAEGVLFPVFTGGLCKPVGSNTINHYYAGCGVVYSRSRSYCR